MKRSFRRDESGRPTFRRLVFLEARTLRLWRVATIVSLLVGYTACVRGAVEHATPKTGAPTSQPDAAHSNAPTMPIKEPKPCIPPCGTKMQTCRNGTCVRWVPSDDPPGRL